MPTRLKTINKQNKGMTQIKIDSSIHYQNATTKSFCKLRQPYLDKKPKFSFFVTFEPK